MHVLGDGQQKIQGGLDIVNQMAVKEILNNPRPGYRQEEGAHQSVQ